MIEEKMSHNATQKMRKNCVICGNLLKEIIKIKYYAGKSWTKLYETAQKGTKMYKTVQNVSQNVQNDSKAVTKTCVTNSTVPLV
jgi:hypothetical protein